MIRSAAASSRMTSVILGIIAAWFAAATVAGAAGVFAGEGPPIAIGISATAPPLLVVALLAWSPQLRRWARSLDLRLLTMLQMWRIAGYGFVAVWAVGELPAVFALPAGFGDVAVGLTAPFVAVRFVGRAGPGKAVFYGWTAFGVLDLVTAIILGVLHSPGAFGLLAGDGPGTDVMAFLPMSLIPTFAVPVMLALHAISVFTARYTDWSAEAAGSGFGRNDGAANSRRSRDATVQRHQVR